MNPDDASTLREQHRIIGAMMGCLPRNPQQNTQLALPLKLLKEEAALLIKKGVCRLVSGNVPLPIPSEKEVEEFTTQRSILYQQQVTICKEQRKTTMRHCMQQIMEGKRQKILNARKGSGSDEVDGKVEKELHEELERIDDVPPLPEAAAMVQIPTGISRTVESACEPVEWIYPDTAVDCLRCRVFEDLWEKGYHLTSGAKFGGDFLVYPGDPLHYHAFYIAVCLPYRQTLTVRQIIAYGRLGSTVKKTVLLASIDQLDNIVYKSLEWTHAS